MTPIRPNAYAAPPVANPAADGARQAAQRAFFDAAMGRANGTAAPAAAAAPAVTTQTSAFAATLRQAPVQQVQRRPDPTAEAPVKILRPGSLLDIRI